MSARRRAGRAGWGILDQSVSSLLTLAVGVAAARGLPAAEFGAFALALSAHWLCLGTSRALASEPFVIRFSGSGDVRRRAGEATGTAVAVGVVLGAGLVVVGLLAPLGALGPALAGVGVVLPALLLQDCLRYVAFAAGRGRLAVATDLFWVVSALGALALAEVAGARHAWAYLLAWGGSAVISALVGCVLLTVVPRPRATRSWLGAQRDLVWRYLGEFTALSGAGQLALYLIGWIAGLSAAGALRGAQILVGPVTMVLLGISLFALPEAVGQSRLGPRQSSRFALTVSGALTAVALLWLGMLLLVRDDLASLFLGDSSPGALEALPGIALLTAASCLAAGAFVGLRAYAAARRSLRVRLALVPAILAGATVGALADGARGGALGMAAATWLGVGLWWWQYRAELRERGAAGAPVWAGEAQPGDVMPDGVTSVS